MRIALETDEEGSYVVIGVACLVICFAVLALFAKFIWPRPDWTLWGYGGRFLVVLAPIAVVCGIIGFIKERKDFKEELQGTWAVASVRKLSCGCCTGFTIQPLREVKHPHCQVTYPLPNNSPTLAILKVGVNVKFTPARGFFFRKPKTFEEHYRVTVE